MESTKHRQIGFVKIVRALLAVTALWGVIAVVPYLWSATADAAPTFVQTNLVSDVDGMAKTTDSHLVNPWGMALGINSGIWVSDNGSGTATTYDGTGQPIPSGTPLVAAIPAPGNNGGKSSPTGIATNDTTGFVISLNGK